MNYETWSKRASRAIRALLASKGESIESLAESTGIAHSTLKRRLVGTSPFTIDELQLIAEHFDVTVSQVLTPPYEDAPAPREAALAGAG